MYKLTPGLFKSGCKHFLTEFR